MKTTGNLVGILVELTARMEVRHDDLSRRHALFLMKVDRNAAPGIHHGDRAIASQDYRNGSAPTRQGLVDGVVDHFIYQMVQTGPVVRITDVHSRSLANRLQTPEHLDGLGAIGFAIEVFVVQVSGVYVRADHVLSVFHDTIRDEEAYSVLVQNHAILQAIVLRSLTQGRKSMSVRPRQPGLQAHG